MATDKRKPQAVFRQIFVLLLSVGLALPVAAAQPSVLELIEQRLQLMKAVAAYKWRRDLPVEDRAREAKVVESAVRTARPYGLTRARVTALLEAQIEAAKAIQRYWIGQWEQGVSPPGEPPDLKADIRPRLISLGRRIIEAAARRRAGGEEPAAGDFAVEGLTRADAERIVDALQALSFYPDRHTLIIESGILRIGEGEFHRRFFAPG